MNRTVWDLGLTAECHSRRERSTCFMFSALCAFGLFLVVPLVAFSDSILANGFGMSDRPVPGQSRFVIGDARE